MSWNIVNSDSSSAANKLQALALVSDSYKYLMDLTTNGVVIIDAIKHVQTNKEKLTTITTMSSKENDNGKESKEPDYDDEDKELEEEQEKETGELNQEETTNEVF